MALAQILGGVTNLARRFFLDRIGFFCNRMHAIDHGEGSPVWALSKAKLDRQWLVILGREHYFESTRDYPIGNLNDVKNVLKNEQWRFPYRGLHLYRIERLSEQAHRITSWVVKQDALDALGYSPLYIFPESACLEYLTHQNALRHDRLGNSIFVANVADGLVSSSGQREIFMNRIGQTLGRQGAEDSDVNRLDGTGALEALLKGILAIFRASPSRFFTGYEKAKLQSYPWVAALKLSAVLFPVYLLITSIYLDLANRFVEYRLNDARLESENSMLVRRKIDASSQLVDQIEELFLDPAYLWVAWDILIDLESHVDDYRAVNSSLGVVTFYLSAPRAVNVLGWLSQDVRVASAEFSIPVKKVRDLEQFAVAVTFNAPDLATFRINFPEYDYQSGVLSEEGAAPKSMSTVGAALYPQMTEGVGYGR